MKTTKFFSVISLALIFSAAISTSAATLDNKKDDQISTTSMIRHSVNVIASIDVKLCNVYMVEILDGNGRLVAPAKIFKPGVARYDFYERAESFGTSSNIRVAALVLAPAYTHFVCENELHTTPVTLSGPFIPGKTYRYDLYPQTLSSKE